MPKGRRVRRRARNQPLPHRTPAPPLADELTPLTPVDAYPRPVTSAETGADGDDTALTAALAAKLREIPTCAHCGGRHTRACPRVKRMQWHANGTLAAVDFWPAGKWSTDEIIWPEDLADTEAE